jgi:hypothetical protein
MQTLLISNDAAHLSSLDTEEWKSTGEYWSRLSAILLNGLVEMLDFERSSYLLIDAEGYPIQ